MAANIWKNSSKNVESDNIKILYETLLDFILQRNGTYCLNKPLSWFFILQLYSVPFIMSLSTENLSYKNPAFTGTYRDNGFTQGHNKRDITCLSILSTLNKVM